MTTGPLGQGISNAVGMAIASKQLAATYNRDGFPIVDNKIWCFTGDGCLQEGVGQECESSLEECIGRGLITAVSLAGHLGLDNLILVYDNNSVTVDGSIDNCFTEDTSAKLKAQGWHVIDVYDGSNDVSFRYDKHANDQLAAILRGFDQAKRSSGKPTLLNIRTVIGYSSRKANTGPAHGQALGDDEVAYVKQQLGFDPSKKFHVDNKVYDYFAECKTKGAKAEDEWNALYAGYAKSHPDLHEDLELRLSGKFAPDDWHSLLPAKDKLPQAEQPTRKSSGIVVQALAPKFKTFVAGSADLLESTFVNFDGQVEFQKVRQETSTPLTIAGFGSGGLQRTTSPIRYQRVCHGGPWQRNGGLPQGHDYSVRDVWQAVLTDRIMSTFFMFWLYAAPAARMAALQKLRFIGIATHDSIGIGEDGEYMTVSR